MTTNTNAKLLPILLAFTIGHNESSKSIGLKVSGSLVDCASSSEITIALNLKLTSKNKSRLRNHPELWYCQPQWGSFD